MVSYPIDNPDPSIYDLPTAADLRLNETADRTRRENETRPPLEWGERAEAALSELRVGLREMSRAIADGAGKHAAKTESAKGQLSSQPLKAPKYPGCAVSNKTLSKVRMTRNE